MYDESSTTTVTVYFKLGSPTKGPGKNGCQDAMDGD